MKYLFLFAFLLAPAYAYADDIDPYVYVIDADELDIISPRFEQFVIIPDEYESPNRLDNPDLTQQITLDGVVPAIEIDRYGNILDPID